MKNAIIGGPASAKAITDSARFPRCYPGEHNPAKPFILECTQCGLTFCRRHADAHECHRTRYDNLDTQEQAVAQALEAHDGE